jgi:2Fe-2S ferredoxin
MDTTVKMSVIAKNTDHSVKPIEFSSGDVLMRVLVNNGMDLEASCDGECACSTCHVLINDEWLSKLEPVSEDEEMMIEYTDNPKPNSRLACQIKLHEGLSGMELEVIGH